jgi:transposase
MIGGLDAHQRVILHPRKLALERWPAWARQHLRATDALLIEATTNAWHIYDQLLPLSM